MPPLFATSFWALVFGSPLKVTMWVGNRLATWTGLAWIWRRLRGHPHRPRWFAAWMIVVNVVSYLAFFWGVWWLTHRRG